MRVQFLNGTEDVQWLKDTHLKGRQYPSFGSFVIVGNEDCPQRVDLYASREPEVDDDAHTITFWQ